MFILSSYLIVYSFKELPHIREIVDNTSGRNFLLILVTHYAAYAICQQYYSLSMMHINKTYFLTATKSSQRSYSCYSYKSGWFLELLEEIKTDLPPLAIEGRPPQESYQELIASKCV